MRERNIFLLIIGLFLTFYLMPMEGELFNNALLSGFRLLQEYARQHVLTCLVPAFFIAGAITVFIKKDAVMKYLGPETKKWMSYGIASVTGSILAVCSCTILPLFASIRKRGAGLGPAITFLFSGPAINIAAMFLTISVLGPKIGLARIIMAISLSILVGITMQLIFREKPEKGGIVLEESKEVKVSHHTLALFFLFLVGILVVNGLQIPTLWKYLVMGIFALGTILLVLWRFEKPLTNEWLGETWTFTKQLMPLLFIGVFVAGFLMPLLPETLIASLVGENTVLANLIASVFGAFMYFSTLTEIPVLQALIAKGMHGGPALALLLAGPSLSLPNMLVVRSVLGTKKTLVYVLLVIVFAATAGFVYGLL
jgi:hypothetical protein